MRVEEETEWMSGRQKINLTKRTSFLILATRIKGERLLLIVTGSTCNNCFVFVSLCLQGQCLAAYLFYLEWSDAILTFSSSFVIFLCCTDGQRTILYSKAQNQLQSFQGTDETH